MDDLRLLTGRGIRRLFGWRSVPDPTTYGRWLRRAGERLAQQLDAVLWQTVRTRWAATGVPRSAMLVLDSTVVLRYRLKQAGAEVGYNPKKRGRPSHHPLVAFLVETGDCLGVRWRPGNANTAVGAIPWIQTLVGQLRAAGVEEITLRLDKGFFSGEMVLALEALGVRYVLKVPDQKCGIIEGCGPTIQLLHLLSAQDHQPSQSPSAPNAVRPSQSSCRAIIPGCPSLPNPKRA